MVKAIIFCFVTELLTTANSLSVTSTRRALLFFSRLRIAGPSDDLLSAIIKTSFHECVSKLLLTTVVFDTRGVILIPEGIFECCYVLLTTDLITESTCTRKVGTGRDYHGNNRKTDFRALKR